MSAPHDWHSQVKQALNELRGKDGKLPPAVALPLEWKADLSSFVRDGQMRQLFGAVFTFEKVKKISAATIPEDTHKKTK